MTRYDYTGSRYGSGTYFNVSRDGIYWGTEQIKAPGMEGNAYKTVGNTVYVNGTLTYNGNTPNLTGKSAELLALEAQSEKDAAAQRVLFAAQEKINWEMAQALKMQSFLNSPTAVYASGTTAKDLAAIYNNQVEALPGITQKIADSAYAKVDAIQSLVVIPNSDGMATNPLNGDGLISEAKGTIQKATASAQNVIISVGVILLGVFVFIALLIKRR